MPTLSCQAIVIQAAHCHCQTLAEPRRWVVLLWVCVLALWQVLPAHAQTYTWSDTGSMAMARFDHTATLLPNGQVLVVGGYNNSKGLLASAELYDPATGNWSATGSLANTHAGHTATLLPNGQVLVTGWDCCSSGAAELYDPATGVWSVTGEQTQEDKDQTATLLPNGQVLVVGGHYTSIYGSFPLSAELYDPATGSWSATGSPAILHYHHTATLLPNGRVLVVGGDGENGNGLASAELYDPATGSWSATGSMITARTEHTATLLPNGQVLVVGGLGNVPLASAELYDPATGSWSATGSPITAHANHTATLLPNGQVLVVGGWGKTAIQSSAELYDPATGSWSAAESLVGLPRIHHTATLLADGRVLVAGGYYIVGNGFSIYSTSFTDAELYDSAIISAVAVPTLAEWALALLALALGMLITATARRGLRWRL